jgi:hypothetical protein
LEKEEGLADTGATIEDQAGRTVAGFLDGANQGEGGGGGD